VEKQQIYFTGNNLYSCILPQALILGRRPQGALYTFILHRLCTICGDTVFCILVLKNDSVLCKTGIYSARIWDHLIDLYKIEKTQDICTYQYYLHCPPKDKGEGKVGI